LTVSIRIFITGSATASQSDLSNGAYDSTLPRPAEKSSIPEPGVVTLENSLPPSLSSLGGVKIKHGRPNIDAMLKEEISTASGRMSVTGEFTSTKNAKAIDIPPVCGSPGIAHAVRHALRFPECGPSNVLSGGPSVTLHIASFGYA